MILPRNTNPDQAERYDGWQKHMAKKAAGKERERHNGRLFCVMLLRGRIAEWTPYRRPKTREEIIGPPNHKETNP